MDGKQPIRTVGGDTTAALLRQARNDDKVKAVVLQSIWVVNYLCFKVIPQRVEALKETGKPVVVSMSSLAASGGYWISMVQTKSRNQPR